MKILSIDIGIKNLACCLFEKPQGSELFHILKWDVVNLSQEDECKTCCFNNLEDKLKTNSKSKGKSKSKKVVKEENVICGKPAKFIKNEFLYCLAHAKKQEYKFVTPDLKPAFLNKQKLQKLVEIADKYGIQKDTTLKKADLLSFINSYREKNCFENVAASKNASEINLVTIGKNIKTKFGLLFGDDLLIDHVIIENQISPIANRMKTIQGMVAQYFIMTGTGHNIEFVSASNKLKGFSKEDKEKYSDRKKLGVSKTLEIMESQSNYGEKIDFFKAHKKKDDLADCFLQGLWFISTPLFKKVEQNKN
jgi:hypothetical protein